MRPTGWTLSYGESTLPVLISQEGQCWSCNWECLYCYSSQDIRWNVAWALGKYFIVYPSSCHNTDTVLYFTLLYYTVLYFILLFSSVLYCTQLNSTVLYFTVFYCSLMYATIVFGMKGDIMVKHHIGPNWMHPDRRSCLILSANGWTGLETKCFPAWLSDKVAPEYSKNTIFVQPMALGEIFGQIW